MKRTQVFVATLVLFILCSAGMVALDRFLRTEITPNGIISFEFIATIERSNDAIAAWGKSGQIASGISLGLDFLYLVLYSMLGSLLLLMVSEKVAQKSQRGGKILLLFAYIFPFAGLLDAVENYSLIQLLLASQNELWPKLAYYCAMAKFGAVITCLAAVLSGYGYLAIHRK